MNLNFKRKSLVASIRKSQNPQAGHAYARLYFKRLECYIYRLGGTVDVMLASYLKVWCSNPARNRPKSQNQVVTVCQTLGNRLLRVL